MNRLIKAFHNSRYAFSHLAANEAAFRQELAVTILALPAAWLIAETWRGYVILISALLLVMIVEVLNTGIEAACNAFTLELHPEVKLAKDCGSLAVLLSIILAAMTWGVAFIAWINGTAF